MKIGILTYHRAHNYGALLQAYALLTYLRGLGHDAEVIDYWPDYHDEDYKLIPYFRFRSFLGKIKSILLLLIGYTRILKRSRGYKTFIKENLNVSDKPRYVHEEFMNEVEYDVVVYGSDQIWRRSNYPVFKGFSDIYFGAYPLKVKRKVAYAASMGIVDVQEKDKPYLRKMLQNFDAISVREEDLKKLVEDLTEKSVSLVLDPVLLLGKEEWLQLNSYSSPAIKEKYIFFYQLIPSTEAIMFTNRLKKYFGYKVIEIRGRVEPLLFGNRYLQTTGPIDFISLIQNAEIVVSTSFHGVAFALLFGKQFYALGMKNNSGRVQTLLDKLDISQRHLTDINLVNLEDKIDYQTVNFKLAGFKQQSQNYLIDALGSDN